MGSVLVPAVLGLVAPASPWVGRPSPASSWASRPPVLGMVAQAPSETFITAMYIYVYLLFFSPPPPIAFRSPAHWLSKRMTSTQLITCLGTQPPTVFFISSLSLSLSLSLSCSLSLLSPSFFLSSPADAAAWRLISGAPDHHSDQPNDQPSDQPSGQP